jgi:hypothetical protein
LVYLLSTECIYLQLGPLVVFGSIYYLQLSAFTYNWVLNLHLSVFTQNWVHLLYSWVHSVKFVYIYIRFNKKLLSAQKISGKKTTTKCCLFFSGCIKFAAHFSDCFKSVFYMYTFTVIYVSSETMNFIYWYSRNNFNISYLLNNKTE